MEGAGGREGGREGEGEGGWGGLDGKRERRKLFQCSYLHEAMACESFLYLLVAMDGCIICYVCIHNNINLYNCVYQN